MFVYVIHQSVALTACSLPKCFSSPRCMVWSGWLTWGVRWTAPTCSSCWPLQSATTWTTQDTTMHIRYSSSLDQSIWMTTHTMTLNHIFSHLTISQINARTELALRYNDISPLENHHCAVAFELLEKVRIKSLSLDSRSLDGNCSGWDGASDVFYFVDREQHLQERLHGSVQTDQRRHHQVRSHFVFL